MAASAKKPEAGAGLRGNNPPHEVAKTAPEALTNGYMGRMSLQVKKHWTPKGRSKSECTLSWTINADGTVSDIKVVKHGTTRETDEAALQAVRDAAPFEALPRGSKPLAIEFSFSYEGPPKPLGLTVRQALDKYGPSAENRILPELKTAQIEYPPKKISLIYLKDENALHLFANNKQGLFKHIKKYTPVSASGAVGPKLKEGDLQVPEGCYGVTNLDAMTHLAFWLDYPNMTDKLNAIHDHRTNLGGNIQVHAGSFSTGCIVLSSRDMEELFLLGNQAGLKNIEVIIVPCNLLVKKPELDLKTQPKWLPKLYQELRARLSAFPLT